jgi:hypothetical protein
MPTIQGDHESWNNGEMADHLPANVEVEDGTVTDLETAEVQSEGQAIVDATVPIPTVSTADDEALSENLEPATAEVAEPAITFLDGSIAHLDETESSSDDIETNDLEANNITTVEATVEETDLEANDTTVEVTVEAVEVVAEVPVSESQAEAQTPDDWDHGNDGWDQTAHDWEQDPNWEASVESAKEQTVEVAVVRISDPS